MVFMFPGGGAQYPQMARGLHEAYPAFREAFGECAALLRDLAGLDLAALLFGKGEGSADAQRMRRPLLGLACLFTVEYALAKLLLAWGVQPQALLGHSMGEYVAACLAGVFSLKDALRLVVRRGQLMESLPAGGALLSVPLAESAVRPLLGAGLAIAAVNTPSTCTVAGGDVELDALAARLEGEGVTCRRLHLDVAAHSPRVDPILEPFRQVVRTIALAPPQVPVLSGLTGTWLTDAEATDPETWVKHLRQPVRFADGLGELLGAERGDSAHVLLEVGPGHTLASFARQHPALRDQVVLTTLRHPLGNQPDVAFLLGALGALWSCGGQVDWAGFHAHEARRRVPLPSYPFERQHFWIEAPTLPAPGERPSPAALEAPRRAELADWFHVPGWKQSVPVAPGGGEALRLLVLGEREPLLDALVTALRREGHEVTVARPGSGFGHAGAGELTFDPRTPEDHLAICQTLGGSARSGESVGAPDVIVHGLGVGPVEGDGRMTAASIARAQERGLHSLLFLTQALDRLGWSGRTRVTALSSHLYRITGDEVLCPEKATMLGWLRTAPFEHAGLRCRAVEVAVPTHPAERAALCAQLCAELAGNGSEPLVAYRGRQRWVPTHDALRVPREAARDGEGGLRAQGVTLITGGLGGVGLAMATALAERGPSKLVLLGRTALPPRSSWEACLADDGADDDADALLRERIRGVLALERLGAEVMVVAADVCSRPEMEKVVAEVRARFGAIHGVVHAAGVPGGGVMLRLTPEAVARTLAPKVEGTRVLCEVLADAPPEVMVLCSALVTLCGAFGSFDYTAANAFLDAFAHASAGKEGTRVVTIGWDRWRQLGMARAVEALHRSLTGEALSGMEEAEGREAFLRILESRALRAAAVPQVVVSREGLDMLLQARPEHEAAPQAAHLAAEGQTARTPQPARTARHGRPALGVAYASPKTGTEERLAALVEALLGIEAVGVDDGFFELGGDSLVGTRLIGQAREAFGLDLSLRDLFEAPTVAGLARRIDTGSVLRAMHAAPDPSAESETDVETGLL
ncbi:Malonyl CoA-acyl carrier protein transacylase [Chondromyces apiculatus DSM 436]|uniref:Malonyl CoA-acyl carrier protein transacylase n=1 Tax=Chondromyces apiculatus DSM 436 TaxID=1192034 RepID=A0A017SXN7_9BACT|nr:Malonyl CoA-acyl carrier protein transacylase [Chondromyces apiculatus DSM 436]